MSSLGLIRQIASLSVPNVRSGHQTNFYVFCDNKAQCWGSKLIKHRLRAIFLSICTVIRAQVAGASFFSNTLPPELGFFLSLSLVLCEEGPRRHINATKKFGSLCKINNSSLCWCKTFLGSIAMNGDAQARLQFRESTSSLTFGLLLKFLLFRSGSVGSSSEIAATKMGEKFQESQQDVSGSQKTKWVSLSFVLGQKKEGAVFQEKAVIQKRQNFLR